MEKLEVETKVQTKGTAKNNIKTKEQLGKSILYFTFSLGKEMYGFEVSSVLEVMEYEKIYRTPGVSSNIRGLINLRGDVVPVVDLYNRFFDQKNDITKDSSIVVIEVKDETESMAIGVLIDSVEAVVDIYENEIESRPEIGLKMRSDFVTGVGKVNDQFVVLLDENKVLDIDELSEI